MMVMVVVADGGFESLIEYKEILLHRPYCPPSRWPQVKSTGNREFITLERPIH